MVETGINLEKFLLTLIILSIDSLKYFYFIKLTSITSCNTINCDLHFNKSLVLQFLILGYTELE